MSRAGDVNEKIRRLLDELAAEHERAGRKPGAAYAIGELFAGGIAVMIGEAPPSERQAAAKALRQMFDAVFAGATDVLKGENHG